MPGATTTKPGSATLPFFGIKPVVLDPSTGNEILDIECEGVLAIKDSWPGQMRTVYGDHERFVKTYFTDFKGYYFTCIGIILDKIRILEHQGKVRFPGKRFVGEKKLLC